ncbi:hypothetical protein T492DRAFT_1026280 [Pavlovales sp. CCMP2436]|nr:hypothetical protein T492DRAFT_1026280 [Pavlovales sp. CCMP2436]
MHTISLVSYLATFSFFLLLFLFARSHASLFLIIHELLLLYYCSVGYSLDLFLINEPFIRMAAEKSTKEQAIERQKSSGCK